ncbi:MULTISPECIES: HEAT repeat domain-containing protein [unclassified Microcoleus]|uniref:HEAT repeat domain-containing protein n=1 Tax=unclassified Microcoleus TaxID=2642155 RepID=UPI002FD4EAE2
MFRKISQSGVSYCLAVVGVLAISYPADAQSKMVTYPPIDPDCPQQQFEQYIKDIELKNKFNPVVERATDGLAYCAARAVPILKKIFQDERFEYLMEDLSRIGKEGKDTFPGVMISLKNQLQSKDTPLEKRIEIATVLGRLGETRLATSTLLKIFADLPADEVREAEKTALALGEIGVASPEVVPTLIKAVQNPRNGLSRSSAALALGTLKEKAAIPVLNKMLKSEKDSLIVTNVALALLSIGGDSKDIPRVITSAILNQQTQFTDIEDLTDRQLLIVRLLGSQMKESVPVLVAALEDRGKREPELQLKVIDTLAEIGAAAKDATPVLIQMLQYKKDPENTYHHLNVIEKATNALGAIGPSARTAVPFLKQLLADLKSPYDKDYLQIPILEALGRIGETDLAVPFLLKILQQEDQQLLVRRPEVGDGVYIDTVKRGNLISIGQALNRIGILALPYLVADLQSPDLIKKRGAAYGLSEIDSLPKETINLLTKVVKDEKTELDTRRLAAYALERANVDVQGFFTQYNLTPSTRATCGYKAGFDPYSGLCYLAAARNGGASLFQEIKRWLCPSCK